MTSKSPYVAAVAAAKGHTFSKEVARAITLLIGHGAQGDAHGGHYVQHLYDRAKNRSRPNLRQVHLIEHELIERLRASGFKLGPGQLGENITTCRLRLTDLEAGSVLQLGTDALVQITGLRQPCAKIDRLQRGLRKAVSANRGGQTYMMGAVMGVVIAPGTVSVGDVIRPRRPADGPGSALLPV